MIIDISELINKNKAEKEIDLQFEKDGFWEGNEFIKYEEPIKVQGEFKKDFDHIIFKGEVKTRLGLNCSRCLESFTHDVHIAINEKFSKYEHEDEDEFIVIKDTSVDFEPIIENNILMELPIKRLCKEECRGLCTECGINLNYSTCDCVIEDLEDDDSMDPRLAKLKDLFNDNK